MNSLRMLFALTILAFLSGSLYANSILKCQSGKNDWIRVEPHGNLEGRRVESL